MPAPKRPRSRPPEEPEEAAASSTASSAADPEAEPRAATNGAGFIADPGPEFDPDEAARQPPPEPAPEILDALWHEETVRGLLEAQGLALHGLAGKAETDWVYTRDELRAIAGPVTRILNRYPATQAVAGSGDELAVIIGLTGYVTRSVRERKAAIEATAPPPEKDPLMPPTFGGDGADDDLPEQPPI